MPVANAAIALQGVSILSNIIGFDRGFQEAGQLRSEAALLENQRRELENDRRRRQFIRQARQQQATALAEATAMGGGRVESSATEGSQGSIFSQIGSELAFFATTDLLNRQIVGKTNAAQRAQNKGNLFSTIGNIASGVGGLFS